MLNVYIHPGHFSQFITKVSQVLTVNLIFILILHISSLKGELKSLTYHINVVKVTERLIFAFVIVQNNVTSIHPGNFVK